MISVGYYMCRVAGKLGKGKGDQDMNPVSLKEIANRLRDAIIQNGIENDWDTYKHEALCEIARDWSEFNKIQYK